MGINKLWSDGQPTYGYYNNQKSELYKTFGYFQNYLYTVTLKGNIHLYAFRFYNNNGSESTATTYAAQNLEAANVLPNQEIRLRIGINTRLNTKPFSAKLMFRVRKANGTTTPWTQVEK